MSHFFLYLVTTLLCGAPVAQRPVLRMEVGHPLISFSSEQIWPVYRWRKKLDLAPDSPVVATVTCRNQKCSVSKVVSATRGTAGTWWLKGKVFGVADDGSALLMLDPSPLPVSRDVHEALSLEEGVTKYVEITYDLATDGRLVAAQVRRAGTTHRRPITWK